MGLLAGIMALLIAASFIVILVTVSNNRKLRYAQDKKNMELLFNQQLLSARLEIQEHTFNQISQEIHDNVGQLLSLVKVQVNILEASAASQGNDGQLVRELKENISHAMTDLRDIAKSLNSDKIKNSSLTELAEHELQRISRIGTIKTFLTVTGSPRQFKEQKKLVTLRIVQECLQNILKHAQAQKIVVTFDYKDTQLIINILDDGYGFDVATIKNGSGLGLGNITSRAILIGGEASINSAPGSGTTVTITLPYE